MEQYNLYKVVPLLVDYIDNLTNWYIRRSKTVLEKRNDQDKDIAYKTLYYVLVEFSKVMAPFLPFLTEAIYRNLVAGRFRVLLKVCICQSFLRPAAEPPMKNSISR